MATDERRRAVGSGSVVHLPGAFEEARLALRVDGGAWLRRAAGQTGRESSSQLPDFRLLPIVPGRVSGGAGDYAGAAGGLVGRGKLTSNQDGSITYDRRRMLLLRTIACDGELHDGEYFGQMSATNSSKRLSTGPTSVVPSTRWS